MIHTESSRSVSSTSLIPGNRVRFMSLWERVVSIGRLIRRGYGRYLPSLTLLMALGFLGSLCEGLGAIALIPLFGSIAGGIGEDPISRFITVAMSRIGLTASLNNLLLLIALLFTLKAVVTVFVGVTKARISTSYEKDERTRLLAAFLRARWQFLLEQKLGHLETVLLINVKNGAVLLEHLCALLTLTVGLAVYFFVALNISAPVTLFATASGTVVFFLIRPLFRRTNKFSKEVETMNRSISHFVNENVIGMKTVKSLTAEKAVERQGDGLFVLLKSIMLRIMVNRAAGDAIFQPLGILLICLIFAFTARSAAGLGAAAAIVYLVQRMFSYFQQVQSSLQAVNEFSPYLRALNELHDNIAESQEPDGGTNRFRLDREIAFKGVGLTYPDGRVGLSGADFEVRKGETVGIIGPSGAGKTTLVDLLLRLFEPTQGLLTIDGGDAKSFILKDWRKKFGYVGQDVFLLNGTISDNIRFHDEGLSDEIVQEAARQSAADEFVRALPQGYDTLVGERGVLLSAGQRQRIIIARVLARDPEVLVLDEATSALDNESEAKIQAVIAGLKGRLTVIVIAHRLSTILGADRIIALDKGRVVEQGEPKRLLDDPASYLHKAYHAGKNL